MQFTDTDKNTFKYQEGEEYFQDWLKENTPDNDDWTDVHHNAFNTDYYIIGTYKEKKWLWEEEYNVMCVKISTIINERTYTNIDI